MRIHKFVARETPALPILAEVVAPVNAAGVMAGDKRLPESGERERLDMGGRSNAIPLFSIPTVETLRIKSHEEVATHGGECRNLRVRREAGGELVPRLALV